MTAIDFYLLEAANANQQRFVAKLALDLFRQQQQVYIHTDSAEAAAALDEQLWLYSESSFIAHEIGKPAPVCIGFEAEPPPGHDHIIASAGNIPDYFSRFERLSVIVGHDEAEKTHAREHYRLFKHRGHPLQHKSVRHNNY